MLYKMGHLAKLTDVRASRVEAVVPGLIEMAITAALTPIRDELPENWELITSHALALEALTVRVEALSAPETDDEVHGTRNVVVYMEDLEGEIMRWPWRPLLGTLQ
ncbi:hypothetical protein MTR67_052292 [Solanum verrucosum]|uniref:Uncharacterized protein n=1 Tax=Solanum verrucosum TaxID=315347 RepID=A0AAF0ZZT6_SOLVR|nr:hypothetical protein MTR67_052292 [Solanum verrucosum]